MGPNAKIEIQPGYKLTITNKTYITSCVSTGNAWEGIYVISANSSSYGSLEINGGSIIEDAFNAVYTETTDEAGAITLSNSFFNRNYRSVYLHRRTPPDHTNRYGVIGSITNCQFICKSAWNSNVDAQLHAPWNGRSRVHIELDCVQLNNPGANFPITNNLFDNANEGVISFYSYTILQSNSFNNLSLGINADDCNNYLPIMRYRNSQATVANTARVYIADNKINCRFDFATSTDETFALYNTLGICIEQCTINKNTDAAFFDLPNVHGIYVYKITGLASGEVNGKLLIVKK